jgi:hypothetical protein
VKTRASANQNIETSAGARERRIVSLKELAKEKRHATYQNAKERRATDPRYLAMKEAVRVQRRATYQKVKDRRKAEAADEKARRKAERNMQLQFTGRRVVANQELVKFVAWEFKGSIAQND